MKTDVVTGKSAILSVDATAAFPRWQDISSGHVTSTYLFPPSSLTLFPDSTFLPAKSPFRVRLEEIRRANATTPPAIDTIPCKYLIRSMMKYRCSHEATSRYWCEFLLGNCGRVRPWITSVADGQSFHLITPKSRASIPLYHSERRHSWLGDQVWLGGSERKRVLRIGMGLLSSAFIQVVVATVLLGVLKRAGIVRYATVNEIGLKYCNDNDDSWMNLCSVHPTAIDDDNARKAFEHAVRVI